MIARDVKTEESSLINDISLALREKKVDKLRELIDVVKATPVALRVDGPTITCLLLSQPIGLALFFEDQEWRDTLTERELNAPDKYGRAAIGLICKSAQGRALVDKDSLFRKKITSQGFCMGGEKSAAYSFLVYPGDIDLMMVHSDLRHKVTTDFLNEGFTDASMPLVFELAKFTKGVSFLTDPIIRQKISEHGLNRCTLYFSPVSFMTRFDEGIVLLADDEFRAKIKSRALNKVDDNRRSAVINICRSEAGCEILARDPVFCAKFSAEIFNATTSSANSPLYQMSKNPAGRKALLVSKYLCRLIQEDALNKIWSDGENKGASACFNLLASPEGRQIFLREKKLRACIRRSVLFSRVMHGEHAGRSVADLLLQIENTKLLRMLDKSIQVAVDEARLDQPAQAMLLQQSGAGMFQMIDEPAKKEETPEANKRCVIF